MTGLFALALLLAPVRAIVLEGNGLTAGTTPLRFGRTTRAEAIAATARLLGCPIATSSHGDCGQGVAIGYAKFRDGFELSFVRGRLSGWTADGPTPRAGRIGVGSTVAALRRAWPDAEIDPGDEAHGGLGPSFHRDDGPHGWLSGTRPTDRVTGLFAGTTCLAGI